MVMRVSLTLAAIFILSTTGCNQLIWVEHQISPGSYRVKNLSDALENDSCPESGQDCLRKEISKQVYDIDADYELRREALATGTSLATFGSDVAMLGINAADTFVTGGLSKALSTISGGIIAVRGVADSDFLYNSNILAIIHQMDADRAGVKAAIIAKLPTTPKPPNDATQAILAAAKAETNTAKAVTDAADAADAAKAARADPKATANAIREATAAATDAVNKAVTEMKTAEETMEEANAAAIAVQATRREDMTGVNKAVEALNEAVSTVNGKAIEVVKHAFSTVMKAAKTASEEDATMATTEAKAAMDMAQAAMDMAQAAMGETKATTDAATAKSNATAKAVTVVKAIPKVTQLLPDKILTAASDVAASAAYLAAVDAAAQPGAVKMGVITKATEAARLAFQAITDNLSVPAPKIQDISNVAAVTIAFSIAESVPIGASPKQTIHYGSFVEAAIDLRQYYDRGTINHALYSLNTDAGSKLTACQNLVNKAQNGDPASPQDCRANP
jgi:hypothetical protein